MRAALRAFVRIAQLSSMCPPGLPATHILFCTRFFFPHFATCQLCAHLAYLPLKTKIIQLSAPPGAPLATSVISVEPLPASDRTWIFTPPWFRTCSLLLAPPLLPILPLCCTAMRGPTSKTCALAATSALDGCNFGPDQAGEGGVNVGACHRHAKSVISDLR